MVDECFATLAAIVARPDNYAKFYKQFGDCVKLQMKK